jgi:hypothetical protein
VCPGSQNEKDLNLSFMDEALTPFTTTAMISAFHFYTGKDFTDDQPKPLTKKVFITGGIKQRTKINTHPAPPLLTM